jgi:hypothetical protein
MSGIIGGAGSKSGVINKLMSSNDYVELRNGVDGDAGQMGTSNINVVWNTIVYNDLITHSSGVLTFTDKGAGTYYITASVNAYYAGSEGERWVKAEILKGASSLGAAYEGVTPAENGGTYANPVCAVIEPFSSGDTCTIQTASADDGTAVLYGTTHCILIKIG